jgi:hypothetical protein
MMCASKEVYWAFGLHNTSARSIFEAEYHQNISHKKAGSKKNGYYPLELLLIMLTKMHEDQTLCNSYANK